MSSESSNPNIPYQDLYDTYKRYNYLSKVFTIIMCVTSVIVAVLAFIPSIIPSLVFPNFIFNGLIVAQVAFVFCHLLFLALAESIYITAEDNRLQGAFDHSFGTRFLAEDVKNYYDSEGVEPGPYKLFVNYFENCYFTYTIAQHMTPKIVWWNLTFIILLIPPVIVTLKFSSLDLFFQIVLIFVQLFATPLLLWGLLKHLAFVRQLSSIYKCFICLFSRTEETQSAALFKNVVAYEKALAYYNTATDSEIYEKLQCKLNQGWEEMKKRYNINVDG